jgi:hypothetical protein
MVAIAFREVRGALIDAIMHCKRKNMDRSSPKIAVELPGAAAPGGLSPLLSPL